MRRIFVLLLLVLPLTAARADAVTLRDIMELSRAGLGEEVLLALIDVDGGVFTIDAATLKELKAAGVGDRVIVALIRSGRGGSADLTPVTEPQTDALPASAPPPQVVVIDHRDAEVREVAVPVPVYVGVPVVPRGHRGDRHVDTDFRPIVPVPTPAPTQFLTDTPKERSREPVYWGWGGKLRPDAWKPR